MHNIDHGLPGALYDPRAIMLNGKPVYFIRFFCFQTKRPIRLKNGQLGKRKRKKIENHTTTNLPGQKLLLFNIVEC
jgi:hypothetical protein